VLLLLLLLGHVARQLRQLHHQLCARRQHLLLLLPRSPLAEPVGCLLLQWHPAQMRPWHVAVFAGRGRGPAAAAVVALRQRLEDQSGARYLQGAAHSQTE
jgi:hypothetical protein